MKNYFNQAIADGLNELGYGVDVPNEKGEMKFGPECHEVATIADKLQALIESWPVVYGNKTEIDFRLFGQGKGADDTHQARLAFVEPIMRQPCKHEPIWMTCNDPKSPIVYGTTCEHCGVELQATWSEKK